MWDSPRLLNLAAMLIAAAAVMALCASAAVWASRRPMFALKSIRVEPDILFGATATQPFRHLDAVTLHSQAIPTILASTRGNFFTADLEVVRRAFESVSWVRRAQVRREWPDRLIVKIEEHQVLATWDDGRLVNTFGELFTANPAEAEEDSEDPLPELAGPVGTERDVASRYLDFKSWLARLALAPDQVTLSPRYAWRVHANNGTSTGLTIELGRERDGSTVPDRIVRMLNAWPQLTSRWSKPTLIDLRYPNGFALRAEGLRLAEEPVKPPVRAARPAAKPAIKPKPASDKPAMKAPVKPPAQTPEAKAAR